MAGQGPVDNSPSAITDEDFSSGKTAIRIASVAALGGLLFGYDSAVINGAVDSIESTAPLITVSPSPRRYSVPPSARCRQAGSPTGSAASR
jgi:hypothetical protein